MEASLPGGRQDDTPVAHALSPVLDLMATLKESLARVKALVATHMRN